MTTSSRTKTAGRWLSFGIGAAAAAYATYAGAAWLRYGHASRSTADDEDPLLDRFIPLYDIVERHHIRVDAPAEITFSSACETDLQHSPVVRAIFRAREIVLGADPDAAVRPRGILAVTQSFGWGVLAEAPGREVVMGAATKPWEANVVFRSLPPDEFEAFNEPDYVKIAWTLRADPVGSAESVFRTETRALATDTAARTKFRRYWSLVSPGIIVIRWAMLRPVKREAERRARAMAASPQF